MSRFWACLWICSAFHAAPCRSLRRCLLVGRPGSHQVRRDHPHIAVPARKAPGKGLSVRQPREILEAIGKSKRCFSLHRRKNIYDGRSSPNQRPPAKRVAWNCGHRPDKQKRVNAFIVAGATGCQAPGLKTTHQPTALALHQPVLLIVKETGRGPMTKGGYHG